MLAKFWIVIGLLCSTAQANIRDQPPGIIEMLCDGEPFYWAIREKYGIIRHAYRVSGDIFMISLTNPIVKVIEICD